MVMECSQVRKLLFEYADTDFPADVRSEVESHLAGCRNCALQFQALREQARALKSLPRLHAPEGLIERVREEVERESLFQRLRKYFPTFFSSGKFLKAAGAVTAAVIVVAVLQSVVYRENKQVVSVLKLPPPAAPSETSRETIIVSLNAPAPLSGIRTRGAAPAQSMAEKGNLPVRSKAMEPESLGKPAAGPKLRADNFKPQSRNAPGEPSIRDAVAEAKRLVVHFGGKVIEGRAAGGRAPSEQLDAEIPARNYSALLDRLRLLGGVSAEAGREVKPQPGSTVHLTLKFIIKSQP